MKIIFSLLLILNISFSQPDSRFDTFDWVLYRQTGSINSITEGYNFAYIATENAGILRFHLYQNRFDEPITTAQGLSDNQVHAVYFDYTTGILWVASENSVDYSYNAEENWFHLELNNTGLHRDARVRQIGSSANYIWINAGSSYLKLDKVSGIVMGILPLPDEDDINWGSEREQYLELSNTLKNYFVTEGWMVNGNQFIDQFGKIVEPSTYYYGKNSNVYIGMEDGTIFIGDDQMEILYPYNFGLNSTNITAFTKDEDSWILGEYDYKTEGITKYNLRNKEFQYVDFENEVNLNPKSFYSVIETNNEVWFGGKSIISIYNKKKDYWRESNESNGVPDGIITAMAEDTSSIWIGSTRGLAKLSKIIKRAEQIDFGRSLSLRRINDLEIVDGNLWIATDNTLLIFDQKNNSLFDFKKYGYTESIDQRKGVFTNFSDIYQIGSEIFISSSHGILKYNVKNDNWMIVVEPSSYRGSKVNNMIVRNEYCFLGTNHGIWQINIEDGNSQLYDFSFIGSVQDMYIQDDILLIGSDNGLIKYLWKKNL